MAATCWSGERKTSVGNKPRAVKRAAAGHRRYDNPTPNDPRLLLLLLLLDGDSGQRGARHVVLDAAWRAREGHRTERKGDVEGGNEGR